MRINLDNLTLLYSERLQHLHDDYQVDFNSGNPIQLLSTLSGRYQRVCSMICTDPIFNDLMSSSEQFDVVLVEAFQNECVLPLVEHFQAPFVYLNSIFPQPWHLDVLGNPTSLHFVPYAANDFTDRMTFWQRAQNAIVINLAIFYRNWFLMAMIDKYARQSMSTNNFTAIGEIERGVSMLLTNTHISSNYQYPKSEDIVEVGGLHCVPSQPLPQVSSSRYFNRQSSA